MQGVEKVVGRYTYNTSKILGAGSYGTVYLGVNNQTKEEVAIKMMPRTVVKETDKLDKEITLMRKLQGPYVVRLLDTVQTPNNYYQILDLCQYDLQTILKRQRFLSERDAIKIMVDLLNGFLELIYHGIIHRDVKPANIMYGRDQKFKLTDFGFARMVDNYAGQRFVTQLGTPLYMSPEILQDQPYTSKSDIWSLGFIFYETLFGITPWTAQSVPELIQNIYTKPLMFPDGIKKVSDLIKDVIRKCLIVNENDRIGWYDLYKHPLFEQYFKNMQDLKQKCEQKAKYIVNRIRGEIIRCNISIEDALVKLLIPQNIGVKEIEILFQKFDSSLTRIEAEHIFNDMAQGKITINVQQFKQWLAACEIPFQSIRYQQTSGGIECVKQIKRAMIQFNYTSQQVFSGFNTEQDGKLKYQQYKLMVLRIDQGLNDAEINDSFCLFDQQNKGYITMVEFDFLIGQA